MTAHTHTTLRLRFPTLKQLPPNTPVHLTLAAVGTLALSLAVPRAVVLCALLCAAYAAARAALLRGEIPHATEHPAEIQHSAPPHHTHMHTHSPTHPHSPTHIGIVAGPGGLPAALRAVAALVTDPAQLQSVAILYVAQTERQSRPCTSAECLPEHSLRGSLDALAAKHRHFSVEYVRGTAAVTPACMRRCLPQSARGHRLLVCGDLPLRECVLRGGRALGWGSVSTAGTGVAGDAVLALARGDVERC
ncbi:hypothetical protein DAKH74_036320 [Maudiozyma humilis]|uniref:Uncharacterized protein n=1 Tax=Maudiozyma humilis TaxID=51915 RepID=A0AAV5RZZ2_MAUHU|nr:hypothetical protein DAKH74_036320 [Kazachstania humilis]